MSFMRNDQHIDAELFDLFLKSDIYSHYAEKFLEPGQVDEVNIEDYLQEILTKYIDCRGRPLVGISAYTEIAKIAWLTERT